MLLCKTFPTSCPRLRHVTVNQLIRFWISRRTKSNNLSKLVRGDNFVSRKLIANLGNILHCYKLERISKVHDSFTITSTDSADKRSLHSFDDRINNWFDSSLHIVEHSRFVSSTVHYFFGNTELTV